MDLDSNEKADTVYMINSVITITNKYRVFWNHVTVRLILLGRCAEKNRLKWMKKVGDCLLSAQVLR